MTTALSLHSKLLYVFPMFSADTFQGNVLQTIMQLEKVYFDLAEQEEENVIVVCDRGAMDPSACTARVQWRSVCMCLSVCLSVHLSVFVCVCLSVHLSVFVYLCVCVLYVVKWRRGLNEVV